jgi:hypothetical protein
MAKKIAIATNSEIHWPPLCAMCRRKDGLSLVDLTSGRVTSVLPNLMGGVTIRSQLVELSYPLCATHGRGLSVANFFTRNTTGFKWLRGYLYFLGPICLIGAIALPIARFARRNNPSAADMAGFPTEMYLVFVAIAAMFLWLIFATRKLPLRVSGQTADVITLSFRNVLYANDFVKLNRSIVVK